VAVLLAVSATPAQAALAVGATAPDIALADQHGARLQLADVLKRHRFAVVAFYVKAFTGG
jgi:peroxiredoxin